MGVEEVLFTYESKIFKNGSYITQSKCVSHINIPLFLIFAHLNCHKCRKTHKHESVLCRRNASKNDFQKLALLKLWMRVGCVEQAGDRGVDRLIGSGGGTSQGLRDRDDL